MSPRTPLPAALGAGAAGKPTRFGREIDVGDEVLARLSSVCDRVDTSDTARVEAGRDWWPLSVVWALDGRSPALPAAVARPTDPAQVAAVLEVCNLSVVPVVPFAGASGVCGGSVPVFGGISLDLTGLEGIVGVDDRSLTVEVLAGTFGDDLEARLGAGHGLTVGHWPQSVALSTVGGWIACRGAGQYSTRFGKIEDMVLGLDVALADGRLVSTGGRAPRAACGPDLTQLFVGSEGTLGVITGARLRAHPAPADRRMASYSFADFAEGLDACRRTLRRGATPAVLRLYDPAESRRQFGTEDCSVLVVVDEGDPGVVGAAMDVAAEECAGAGALGEGPAATWLEHRNQVPPLESLAAGGVVADTVEVAASWTALGGIYSAAVDALLEIEGTLAASAHQSHAYPEGGCLYFTFAGTPEGEGRGSQEAYYRRAFDAVMSATEAGGGAISHHHGIGLNRGRYLARHLGEGFGVLASLKAALDPNGVLNPGKLGLPSPFGAPEVP